MKLELPFYLGRREDIKAPNRRIASRTVKFNNKLKKQVYHLDKNQNILVQK